MKQFIKYILFCVLAIIVNLSLQRLSLFVYSGPFSIYIALFWGTLSGLVLKYILDKKYIFYHQHDSLQDNAKSFTLYTVFGLLTTAVFWATELAFFYLYSHPFNKEIGGTLGLSIGYIIKYQLDKKFVFRKPS